MFDLRLKPSDIRHWADRYTYTRNEQPLVDLAPAVRSKGMLNLSTLRMVAEWKSPRSAGHVSKNSERFLQEVSALAFSARDERARIESLTLLDGVLWPTASVILHLFHADPYPILDFRALWSLGCDPPKQYCFTHWWSYVEYCRGQYDCCGCDPRTFDRALWQYSKENQPSKQPNQRLQLIGDARG